MKVQLIGRVLDVNLGEKYNYVILNDTEIGGQIKLSMPTNVPVNIDSLVKIDAIIKPGMGKYGMFLSVISLNQSESKEKGE